MLCWDSSLHVTEENTTGPGSPKFVAENAAAAIEEEVEVFVNNRTHHEGYWDIITHHTGGAERSYLVATFNNFSIPSESLRLYHVNGGEVLINGESASVTSGTGSYCW